MSESTETQDVSSEELDFDDLDNFSSTFFGQNKSQPEETTSVDEAEAEDTETGEPVDETEVESEESEDTADETEDQEEEKPQPKPSRAQERITELNAKYREQERQNRILLDRLEALEKGSPKTETPNPTATETGSPTPTDKNEDGSDKYPLGEFDPDFIRDLTKHTIAEATKDAKAQAQQDAEQARQDQEQQQLNAEWVQKQGPAQERYSDYGEKVASLESVFDGVDPSYGEYLARTVMSMDKGPEVLYHLANNPDEARELIGMGATKATIRLARLETRFLDEGEKPQPKPRVSQAPTPPPANKGSAGGRKSVAPDTDDLDAFSAEFFRKKK